MNLLGGNIRGQRKFVIALLALLCSFALALVGKMTGSEWVTAVGLVVGLYGAANAATAAVAGGLRNDDT